jgi:hypothetical protein
MSNYSCDPRSCRVDFFKDTGKWYETEAVVFLGGYVGGPNNPILEDFRRSLNAHLNGRLKGMQAVCLSPYHENSHPISIIIE